jgi:N-acyl-D-aspartate/D-glutamate deacylase
VASDGFVGETPSDHPRSSGTFSRVLGRYVRERKALSLMSALRKMTVQPVLRLEPGAPALRTKGRLAPGMDADVTVFDPLTVIDRSTFQNPRQASAGITHVLVNGKVAVRDGKLQEDTPGAGQPILGAGFRPRTRPRLAAAVDTRR